MNRIVVGSGSNIEKILNDKVVINVRKDTNLLIDHRGDKNYKLWDTAYLRYKEEVEK